jgi:hypothetical protein
MVTGFKAWTRKHTRVLTLAAGALSILASLCTIYSFFGPPSGVPAQKLDKITYTPLNTVPILAADKFDQNIKPGHVLADAAAPKVPLPKSRPNPWEKNYSVWVLDSEQGDDPDVVKLRRGWRSCALPSAPPICSKTPSFRRWAEPLKGY